MSGISEFATPVGALAMVTMFSIKMLADRRRERNGDGPKLPSALCGKHGERISRLEVGLQAAVNSSNASATMAAAASATAMAEVNRRLVSLEERTYEGTQQVLGAIATLSEKTERMGSP